MQKVSNYIFLMIMLGIMLLTPAVIAQTQTNTLHFDLGENNGWVPYRTGKTVDQSGILAELVLLIEEYTSIEFQSVNLPMKRAEMALIKGAVDFDFICTAWFEGGDYGNQFVISEPLFEINEYVVTLKDNKQLFPTLDSIYNQPIGTVAGYFYFDDAQFTRVDFRDEESLMKALKLERIQAIIFERETAKHWAEAHNTDIAFATPHTTGKLLIRFNKTKQVLLPAINQAIIKIKQSGQLQVILNKYGVEAKIF